MRCRRLSDQLTTHHWVKVHAYGIVKVHSSSHSDPQEDVRDILVGLRATSPEAIMRVAWLPAEPGGALA